MPRFQWFILNILEIDSFIIAKYQNGPLRQLSLRLLLKDYGGGSQGRERVSQFLITDKPSRVRLKQGQDMEYKINKYQRLDLVAQFILVYQFDDTISRAVLLGIPHLSEFMHPPFYFCPTNYKKYKHSARTNPIFDYYIIHPYLKCTHYKLPISLRFYISTLLSFRVQSRSKSKNLCLLVLRTKKPMPRCRYSAPLPHLATTSPIQDQYCNRTKGWYSGLVGAGKGPCCLADIHSFRFLRNSIIYRYIEKMQPNKTIKNNSDVFRSSFTFSESKHTSNNTTCAQSFFYEQTPPPDIPAVVPSPLAKPAPQTPPLASHSPSRGHYRKSEYIERRSELGKTECLFSKYQAIQQILYSQNLNLKQQNALLLAEIHRLRDGNRKYRALDQAQRIELQKSREEAQAYKNKAEQLQLILSTKLAALEQIVLAQQKSEANQTLEDLLNYSDQFSK